jgi:formylmethanofuran dehydrogenase subunit E-like metal-binding protein
MQEVSLVKRVQKEQKEIFESLEEGILLIKENEIAFSNSIFNDII